MKLSECTREMLEDDYNSEEDQRICRAIEYGLYQMHIEAGSEKSFKLKHFEDDK